MSYAIRHIPEMEIVELGFTGTISGSALKEATTQCIRLQKEMGITRFLVDGNDWEVAASVVDIYKLPAEQYWDEKVLRQTRIAVVMPGSADAQEAVQFYRDACWNQGWNAQIHLDRKSALDWLTDSSDD